MTLHSLMASATAAPARPREPARPPEPAVVSRIAFGSCAGQTRPQPIWRAVADANPDLFVFLGDNVYADTTDPLEMRKAYALLADQPGFRWLRENVPIRATWDDHDYGIEDGGAEHPAKEPVKQVFLDFFEEPAASPVRQRAGIHNAAVYGPRGRRVQVILLDTRTFRSPLVSTRVGGETVFLPNPDPKAALLGEEQWTWLERQLKRPAEIRIIGSSIQVISDKHRLEKWGNFPEERARLLALLDRTQAAGVIFVSGDRHFAELSALGAGGGDAAKERGLAYPLYDLTSSSLNLTSRSSRFDDPNPHRVALVNDTNNFGLIEIDWEKKDPVISLQIRGEDGENRYLRRLWLSELR